MKTLKSLRISINTWNILLMLVLVLSTAALIHIPWYIVSKQNIASLTNKLNTKTIDAISEEVNALFESTSHTLSTVKYSIENGVVDIHNKEQLQDFFLSLINTNQTFSWISFGAKNGDFYGVNRQDDTHLRFIKSIWQGTYAKRSIDYYDVTKGTFSKTSSRQTLNHYNALNRTWYKKAVSTKKMVWTDVYLFSTTKQPGVNAAVALELNGEFIGVITIAMELKALSHYLKTIKVSENGTVFLINTKSEIIAFSDSNEVQQLSFNALSPSLKKLHESEYKLLKIAHESFLENALNLYYISDKKHLEYKASDEQTYYINLQGIQPQAWFITTVVPEDDFLGAVKENTKKMYLTIVFLLFCAVLLIKLITQRIIVKPLSAISKNTAEISQFKLHDLKQQPALISEIDHLSQAVHQMGMGLNAFRKYLPLALVKKLIHSGIEAKLGGESREVTLLFSDLVGFTKLTEEQGERLIPHLSEYFHALATIIMQQHGTIDKYIGDAVMAFWGAPIKNKNHALDACRSALYIQKELKKLRLSWKKQHKPLFHTRIGVNTGKAIVGNIGSEDKMDYTALGNTVNLAARLEALNKHFGTEVLIGEETYHDVKHDVLVRRLGKIAVYGKEEACEVYELLALIDEIEHLNYYDWVQHFEDALILFEQQEFVKALRKFKRIEKLKGTKDTASNVYIKRCQEALESKEEIEVVTKMQEK